MFLVKHFVSVILHSISFHFIFISLFVMMSRFHRDCLSICDSISNCAFLCTPLLTLFSSFENRTVFTCWVSISLLADTCLVYNRWCYFWMRVKVRELTDRPTDRTGQTVHSECLRVCSRAQFYVRNGCAQLVLAAEHHLYWSSK